MKKYLKTVVLLTLVLALLALSGCLGTTGQADGPFIVDAEKAAEMINDGTVLVDAQMADAYDVAHIEGAVNITRGDIVVSEPFPNMVGGKEQIEKILGDNGIGNGMDIIVYDDNNHMDAARFWWTLKAYGNEDVKVVSGGLKALEEIGMAVTDEVPDVEKASYEADELDESMVATIDTVIDQLNYPDSDTFLIDTRTTEEFEEGTIPSSIHINYVENQYADGSYKSAQDISIMYMENGIEKDATVIMYCKSSIRGAQTYLALANAGYENLKLYDGAWLEWSSDKALPIQTPSGEKVEFNEQDAS
ncbi:MAG TPA: rhodanese-like domain-containing protein [Clostridia bacterium]|nr:rhodanese-like domain-containing protein [Clostridia bacterium]